MQIIDPSSSLGCASQAGDLAALEERTEQLGELVVGDASIFNQIFINRYRDSMDEARAPRVARLRVCAGLCARVSCVIGRMC